MDFLRVRWGERRREGGEKKEKRKGKEERMKQHQALSREGRREGRRKGARESLRLGRDSPSRPPTSLKTHQLPPSRPEKRSRGEKRKDQIAQHAPWSPGA